jgi:hypothetical protein
MEIARDVAFAWNLVTSGDSSQKPLTRTNERHKEKFVLPDSVLMSIRCMIQQISTVNIARSGFAVRATTHIEQ